MKYLILVVLIFFSLLGAGQSYIYSWESNTLNRIEYNQTEYFFNNLDLRGSSYLTGKNRGTAEFYNTSIDTLLMYGFNSIGIIGDKQKEINLLDIKYDSFNYEFQPDIIKPQEIYLEDHVIKDLRFRDCIFSSFEARFVTVEKNLTFRNCNFVGKLRLYHLALPDTLRLFNVDLSKLEGDFDLYTSINFDPNKIHYVSFWKTDINKVSLHYEYFKLYFPKNEKIPFEEKVSVYQDLLSNFSKRGAIQSYERLDKEFRKFKYTDNGSWFGYALNWIDSNWWDYGYDKFLILRNALILYLGFFIINIFLYKHLVEDVYALKKFTTINQEQNRKYSRRPLKRTLVKLPYIFLYTGYIFWGWKLEMHSISVDRIIIFSYVLLQYLVGIVCLGYIANLIITR